MPALRRMNCDDGIFPQRRGRTAGREKEQENDGGGGGDGDGGEGGSPLGGAERENTSVGSSITGVSAGEPKQAPRATRRSRYRDSEPVVSSA